ncbi:MAG: ABC transporter permease [Jiangellaceae bacterium]|nr:ABC transporter permease [Jiangellaceae bacterium]
MAASTELTAAGIPVPGRLWDRAFGYWLASYRRVWRGSVFEGFVQPLFFLAALGFGLGALVDARQGGVDGVSYVQFIAPGILAAQAMQTAFGEATYPVLGSIKWQRQYHAMLAAPLQISDIVLGHLVFVLLRVTITTVAFLAVSWLLGTIPSPWAVLALPVAVLCGMAYATPIFAFAARQDDANGFALLFRFGFMPMFLFSGTFFPVDQLPGWLQPLTWLTPLWHGVELCRALSMGTPTLGATTLHVGYLLAWMVGGYFLAVRSLRRRLVV